MKIAVYVEGQTELIFVREFLRKWFDYDPSQVGFRCYELRSIEPGYPTEYSFGDENAVRFYTIVNVGCDTRVLSKALDNAPKYQNLGYDRMVVLRDMYSDEYKKLLAGHVIDSALNARFMTGARKTISNKGFDGFIHSHFAIMEVEAWFLGMGWYFEKEHSSLTQDNLLSELDFNLGDDPEEKEFHPAARLKKIYNHIGKDYDKHAHEVNSIMSKIEKGDFEMLLALGKCESFRRFKENLTL